MVLNKIGQVGILGLMLWFFVIILSIIMITPLKELISIARGPTYLDCTNTSISVGQQATCIVVDFWLFYFVISSMGAGLAYITGISVYNRIRAQ